MTEVAAVGRAEASRARLLAAAADAFAEKGFHGTTTRDISTRAGMSPAALYTHHESKEELLYLIAKNGTVDALARLKASLATSDEPVQQLRCVVRDFAAASARHNTVTRVINYQLEALTPAHRREVSALRRKIGVAVRGVIQRGIDSGDFDVVDAGAAATIIMSLGIDVARWYRAGGAWPTPEALGDDYATVAMRILGVDAGKPGAEPLSAARKSQRKEALGSRRI